MREGLIKEKSRPHQPNGWSRTVVLSDPAEDRQPAQPGSRTVDVARIWTDDLCGGRIETMAFRFVKHRFRPHTHETLMLGLIESGTKAFARERKIHVARPGSVSMVNPGELHTGYRLAGEALRYRSLYIPEALLSLAAKSLGLYRDGASLAFQPGVIHDPDIYHCLIRAHDAIADRATRLTREHYLLEGMGLLVGRHGRWRPTRNASAAAPVQVRRARDFIDAQYADDLAIADLATAVGMSPYHLMREFRKHVGMPMHAYQIQARIERAKRMLALGVPVADVALNVGFADQSHFSKRFKDLVGAPPATYQRALTSGGVGRSRGAAG